MRNSMRVGLAIIAMALTGCGVEDPSRLSCLSPDARPGRVYGDTLAELTYIAVDQMTICVRPEISPIVPIAVSSITESQRLDTSSSFGNMVADFARSRLAKNQMNVSEPRLRSSMLLKQDQGEMMLGRDPHSLVMPPPYSAILTGTYGVGETSVFVSLKLIRVDNAQILAAADFEVRRAGDVDNLLHDLKVARTRK